MGEVTAEKIKKDVHGQLLISHSKHVILILLIDELFKIIRRADCH